VKIERIAPQAVHVSSDEQAQFKMQEIQKQKNELTLTIQKMEEEYLNMQVAMQRLENENYELQKRNQQAEAEAQNLPKERNILGFYANISKIHWDYNSDNIKGTVTVPQANDIRPFHLPANRYTHFEIVNYMWDIME